MDVVWDLTCALCSRAVYRGFSIRLVCACSTRIRNRDGNLPEIAYRMAVGNFYGAKKILNLHKENPCKNCESKNCEKACIRKSFDKAVNIKEINANLLG